jgi:nicotinate-nucleotide adenylyltransferase
MLGVFGGTFDPIHFGHLRPAWELAQALSLEQIAWIPCGVPPHRGQPRADAALRLRMLQAAVRDVPGFYVDERELHRPGPSYMVDTLSSLRAEIGERSLCLLLGMDAFVGLADWHEWRRLPQLAHLVVAQRPGWDGAADGQLQALLGERLTTRVEDLQRAPAGRILFAPVTQLEISATRIRALVAAGQSPRFLLPEAVRRIIEDSGVYGGKA